MQEIEDHQDHTHLPPPPPAPPSSAWHEDLGAMGTIAVVAASGIALAVIAALPAIAVGLLFEWSFSNAGQGPGDLLGFLV